MQVFVLRHAIAEEAGPGRPDKARALTAEGRAKLSLVLKRAAAAGVAPGLILTSPYVRAKQTARMAAETLGCEDALRETDTLVPGSSPQAVWNEVRENRSEEQIMLVGHEPLLGYLVSYLLGSPGMQVEMRKAAMVAIGIESVRGDPRGVLLWMLTPKLVS